MSMSPNSPSNSNAALADCALWAFRDLTRALAQPDVSSSALIDQIILTARALRTFRDSSQDAVSADFLREAINAPVANDRLPATPEELICGAVTVISNREPGEPHNEWASGKVYEWLADACSRRKCAA